MENENKTNTNKADSISIINKEIANILNQGKELTEVFTQANEELKKLQNGTDELKNKKTKLLNILLKHSKKKLLFKFKPKDNNNRWGEYEVGLNTSGLGIAGNYDNNLRNITDYYARDNFMKLCNDELFVKEFLSHIKDENKEIIKKCITAYGNSYKERLSLGNNVFIQIDNSISLNRNDNSSYRDSIDIFKSEDIITEKKDFSEDDEYLLNISNIKYNIKHRQILDYQFLINNKEKIIKTLNEKIKYFQSEFKELNSKVVEIDAYLKPYEALEQI